MTKGHSLEMQARMALSHPGMATWAVLDSGKTCLQCQHWGNPDRIEKRKGDKRKRRCSRYTQFNQGVGGPAVPHYATSCSVFEERK